jgi:hypothetical protein
MGCIPFPQSRPLAFYIDWPPRKNIAASRAEAPAFFTPYTRKNVIFLAQPAENHLHNRHGAS